MFLSKAEVICFRNYEKLSLEFTKPLNIFIGNNGQGKSSFLEALYYGLRGKSFYPFITNEVIKEDKENSRISLYLKEEEGSSTLVTCLSLAGNKIKKEFFYCEKKVGPAFLSRKIPCFVFTEESMKCIRQGRSQRLAFIDEMLEGEKAKSAKEKFHRVLKEKKAVLKKFQKKELSLSKAEALLSALNPSWLKSSCHLVEKRLALLKKLFSTAEKLKKDFFKDPLPDLEFSYSLLDDKEIKEGMEISTLLEKEMKDWKDQELRAGIPLSGPQKHELVFFFNNRDSRTFCSKGQQRAFLLSLLLSHIQSQFGSLLFLDDVLLELDEKTQQKFLNFLEKSPCQTFLTNSRTIPFKMEKADVFSVEKGLITSLD